MSANPVCLTDLTALQLQGLISSLGEPAYRARQLQHWLYGGLAASFEEMTSLPLSFRQKLAAETRLHSLEPIHEIVSADGTVKVLLALADGKTVESTLMAYPGTRSRHTVCVSTQVGCPIGCPFCATGQQGFERNLTPGEIIDQVLYFARYLRQGRDTGAGRPAATITNLVFMGMGEPMANYEALLQAVEMLNSPDGFGLGARNMVVSTSGLVPRIQRLAEEDLQVGLAVSLHAPDDDLRDRLVPVNRTYPLEILLQACREYVAKSGRRISFEYILFKGINDSVAHAHRLAKLLAGLDCHVNLIPANETGDKKFRPPERRTVLLFENELSARRVACTLREKRGLDIDAGCGQLRSRFLARAGSFSNTA